MSTLTLLNGMEVPQIGLGTFGGTRYSPEQVAQAVYGAIKTGYRLINCAASFGNEEKIGEALEQAMEEGLVARDDLIISSKVASDMHGKGDVLLSCAQTLRDLRLDYLDMYVIQWPFSDTGPFDVGEFMMVWRQMEKLLYMGLVRSIGMSNMTITKLDAVLPLCRIRPSVLEMELHPAFQQQELFYYCYAKSIQPIGICPLGSPNRADKDDDDISVIEMPEIVAIAETHKVHPAIVCIKWAVQRGQIPVPFAIDEIQYTNNLRWVSKLPLTESEMEKIEVADKNCRLLKGKEYLWEDSDDWQEIWDNEA